ncbi:DUF3445 domain-containing protein [Oceanobacillus sp. FSL K6-2867]|uniref:heme-dependent oxidative N-demethylase family protein n=1 Tax=Oceanobacillus sp. FSL K6-2867 TaxID=2954748 RepID=UPI0030DC1258
MVLQSATISNKPLLDRFPFPFNEDIYRYSNNSRKLDPPHAIEITPEYVEEIKLKRELLDTKKEQTFNSLPHSIEAQWEILEMLMNELVSVHPNYFSLKKENNNWIFQNHLLGEEQSFTFGDLSSLPYEPLDFIGRHVQEDLIYLGQRDGQLYLDAGQLCFPADWSVAFDLGMEFVDIHNPTPDALTTTGLVEKIRDFLLRMEADQPWMRDNWTITVDRNLTTSPETYGSWGSRKNQITVDNAGQIVHLRVETQGLFRLPLSNGILFSIHTHLIPFEELIKNNLWMHRTYNVIKELPNDLAEYKGFISFRDTILKYLEQRIEESSSIK